MPKYKVNKFIVKPNISSDNIFKNRFCVVGVSINNPHFYGFRQKAVLNWTSKHFEKSLIWVADYSHRLNIQLFQGVDESKAIELAYQAGDDFVKELNENLTEYPDGKFSIIRKDEIYHQPVFLSYFKTFKELYKNDEVFIKSVRNSAEEYIKKQIEKGNNIHINHEQAIQFSALYLLEEMAVFGYLVEQGWLVNVYPGGQLPTLDEIAEGKFPNLPESIRKRIFINLKIQKR